MTRPRIGITCDITERNFPEAPRTRDLHRLNGAYVEAVLKAGGVPLLLPAIEESAAVVSLEALDALIISGGGHDINPQIYEERRLAQCGPSLPKRQNFELAICREALSRDMPVLGVCGGVQVLNVAAGGTLIQDIATQVKHALEHRPADEKRASYVYHEVEVFPSLLEETIGVGVHTVNSHHHQSVKELAAGFRLSAQSPDGIVEGIESESHRFVVGVQWHPEAMSAYGFGDADTAEHIIARLAEEAREYSTEVESRRS